jgi:dihydroxy-acid dehydratase
MAELKLRSHDGTTGMQKAGARAMLRAVGMTDDDWDKPQIGVASSWNEVTPCNLSLDRLADAVKQGVRAAGGYPLEFCTITVSDGIAMGHDGMHASLVSREVICDSVETVVYAERMDGVVTLAGCDKSIPGMMMAMARLDLPSVLVYAGAILPGVHNGRNIDIANVFEAIGACAAGTITTNEMGEIERKACPTEGACAGMFTANTMAAVGEALGLSLPGRRRRPPSIAAATTMRAAGRAVIDLLAPASTPVTSSPRAPSRTPSPWSTRFGGSTNAAAAPRARRR